MQMTGDLSNLNMREWWDERASYGGRKRDHIPFSCFEICVSWEEDFSGTLWSRIRENRGRERRARFISELRKRNNRATSLNYVRSASAFRWFRNSFDQKTKQSENWRHVCNENRINCEQLSSCFFEWKHDFFLSISLGGKTRNDGKGPSSSIF